MKIRTGFVSNSSSSSFVVVIDRDKIPTSEEAILKTLVGGENDWECDDEPVENDWRAKRLFEDIMEQLDNAPILQSDLRTKGAKKVSNEFHRGYLIDQIVTYNENRDLQYVKEQENQIRRTIEDQDKRCKLLKIEYENHKKIKKRIIDRYLKEFITEHLGKTLLTFSYSDNCGESDIEHCDDVWNWVTQNGGQVVCISHH